jgi:hypothetical protein
MNHFAMRKLFAFALLYALTACSSSDQLTAFTTDGVVAPDNSCAQDPSSFAEATRVPDFGEGNGCGIINGYKLTSIDGIKLSQPATMTCNVANTFHNWLQQSVTPKAQQMFGAKITEIKIAASYACRPRNGVRGAKLSEHGHGNAIDIAGFTFDNGHQITVFNDYYGMRENQAFFSTIRHEACGPFHTVLGPGSDSFHRDHIHLDLQKERSGGPYCH